MSKTQRNSEKKQKTFLSLVESIETIDALESVTLDRRIEDLKIIKVKKQPMMGYLT